MPQRTNMERWLPVPGFEDYYAVSDLGRVRSVDRTITDRIGRVRRLRGKILSLGTDGEHYPVVGLKRGGTATRWYVHVLVLTVFRRSRPANAEGCHNNDVPWDNRLCNLRWDTHSNNMRDMVRLGTHHRRVGDSCPLNHRLIAPNIRVQNTERNVVSCLACNRASANKNYAKKRGRSFDHKATADRHYAQIMAVSSNKL